MQDKIVKRMERIFKGVANHHRINILCLVSKTPGITLESITEELKCNIKTISEHTRKLKNAGLVAKKYKGRSVEHYLTPYGEKIIAILVTF